MMASLEVTDFRNIQYAKLAPTPKGINLIYGNNGDGKTSLLESIYYLGLGRSFRSAIAGRLISHSAKKFLITSQILTPQKIFQLGTERDVTGSTRTRVAEKDVSNITELAKLLPLRIINSQSHHLFESGPLYRRKFIDWGLFYHQDNFLYCWRNFERSLKQRNTLLREKRSKKEIDVWTEEFIKYSLQLHELRQAYVLEFRQHLEQIAEFLLEITDCHIAYHPGWHTNHSLRETLAKNFTDEVQSGHTQYGPHRADFSIMINDKPAKHFLSRGQQKLLICGMIIAQGKLLQASENKGLIYLIDDLAAELDPISRKRLIGLFSQLDSQIFMTAIEKKSVYTDLIQQAALLKVFHVEHGKLEEELQ